MLWSEMAPDARPLLRDGGCHSKSASASASGCSGLLFCFFIICKVREKRGGRGQENGAREVLSEPYGEDLDKPCLKASSPGKAFDFPFAPAPAHAITSQLKSYRLQASVQYRTVLAGIPEVNGINTETCCYSNTLAASKRQVFSQTRLFAKKHKILDRRGISKAAVSCRHTLVRTMTSKVSGHYFCF